MARRVRWYRTTTIVLSSALLLGCWTQVAQVQPVTPGATRDLTQDSLLAGLVREALENRPELAQARANAKADLERAPQAAALPDPIISGGIQNDGFNGIQVGKMETSWWSVTAAQTLPWFGKRDLRGQAETLGARQSATDVDRAQLSIQADVERGYLALLLARDQLKLLGKLATLWVQAEGLSRSRYESGQGAQVDILRAQLERSRLNQQRAALLAEERRSISALDRAVGRPLDSPIDTEVSLAELSDPALPDSMHALADVEARSPELRRALLGVDQAAALTTLAQKDYYPDLTLSGGIMPRGGDFEHMWQAGVSISIPLWAGSKQSHAVSEYRLRGDAASNGAEAVRRALRERLEERRALFVALLETNRLFRSGLLVQSEATVSSTMAQYQVGRVPFASVLETLSGYYSDLDGYYQSVAALQRLDIAQRELSLEPVAGAASRGFGGTGMPGANGMSGGAAAPAVTPVPQPAAGSTSTAMPRM